MRALIKVVYSVNYIHIPNYATLTGLKKLKNPVQPPSHQNSSLRAPNSFPVHSFLNHLMPRRTLYAPRSKYPPLPTSSPSLPSLLPPPPPRQPERHPSPAHFLDQGGLEGLLGGGVRGEEGQEGGEFGEFEVHPLLLILDIHTNNLLVIFSFALLSLILISIPDG